MYDVLGDSLGNTVLSRGVCGALCLGVRSWGFPGEYLSGWWGMARCFWVSGRVSVAFMIFFCQE